MCLNSLSLDTYPRSSTINFLMGCSQVVDCLASSSTGFFKYTLRFHPVPSTLYCFYFEFCLILKISSVAYLVKFKLYMLEFFVFRYLTTIFYYLIFNGWLPDCWLSGFILLGFLQVYFKVPSWAQHSVLFLLRILPHT